MGRVLVTGGAGYIGTHTLIALVEAGFEPVVFDNFSNSSREAVFRVERIVDRGIPIIDGDVRNQRDLDMVFSKQEINAVVHFAALKSVSESISLPLEYYENNLVGTLNLVRSMARYSVNALVFSSSATVYAPQVKPPFSEDSPLGPVNPYGSTKLMAELMLKDICASRGNLACVSLRYFNPIGAHPSGQIGEDPRGIPNNIFPYLTQVAVGRQPYFRIFGDDYPTRDGTGVRDYVHVMDVAEGHVSALKFALKNPGYISINLGTGHGTSVKELVRAFVDASGKNIPIKIEARRPGDVAESWADPKKAKTVLGWTAVRGIEQMCADGWRWQRENPSGYEGN